MKAVGSKGLSLAKATKDSDWPATKGTSEHFHLMALQADTNRTPPQQPAYIHRSAMTTTTIDDYDDSL